MSADLAGLYPPRATDPTCVFCKIIDGTDDGNILGNWGSAIALAPLKPITRGHALVLPVAHVPNAVASPEMAAMTMRYAAIYAREHTESANIITSIGAPATQTVFHLHVHVVPRREDDLLELPWTAQQRCPSCEHEVKIHSEDGCWHGVRIGRLDKPIGCPCAVSREQLEARP